jgi:mRNA interferase MazF
MKKRFDEWNSVKQKANDTKRKVGFKVRDIFWLRIGQNIGTEEFGKGNEFQRPVLVVRKLTHDLFIGIPLTSSLKEDNDYFYTFEFNTKKGLSKNSAMILQLKSFDKKRLMGKIGTINKESFNEILERIRMLFIPLK